MKKILISGYKMSELGIFNQKNEAIFFIKEMLKNKIKQLCEDGLEWIIVSGQLGTEMWSLEVSNELKEEFPNLKTAIVVPFNNHEKNWNDDNKNYYYDLKNKVDMYQSTSNYDYVNPIQFFNRDKAVMEKVDGAILFYDEEKEGSPKYMKTKLEKYKEKKDLFEIIRMDFYDLQSVIDDFNSSSNWDEGIF